MRFFYLFTRSLQISHRIKREHQKIIILTKAEKLIKKCLETCADDEIVFDIEWQKKILINKMLILK